MRSCVCLSKSLKMFNFVSKKNKLLASNSNFLTNCYVKPASSNQNPMNFDEISGPKSYSLVGTLYKYWPIFGDYDAESMDKNSWLNWRRYGGLVRENPGVRVLHVYEPDLIELIFRQNDRHPDRRSHVAMLHYRNGKPQIYNSGGLLSTNGPQWWKLRRAFQRSFSSPQSAQKYIDVADAVACDFVQWIKDRQVSSDEDFLLYLNRLYLEVIGVIAFGEKFQSFSLNEQEQNSRSSKIIRAAFESNSGIFKLDKGVFWRLFTTPLYRKLVKSQEYLEKVSIDILLKKARFFENRQDSDGNDLVTSFLQLSDIDLKDITGMMVDILMASVDTTSYSTSFILYHLAKGEDCQRKCYEEAVSLLPNKDSKITADVLSNAVFIKSCIKESLRLNPVSIGVGRILQKDLVLKGYLIPKGTVIVTQNMVASRLPQYLRDPLHFKPERWIRGSAQYENIHPFLSLPFGFGPRSCIARRLAEQNMCITIMRLLREYKIKWMGGDLGVKTLLINKPDKPVTLSFTPRCK